MVMHKPDGSDLLFQLTVAACLVSAVVTILTLVWLLIVTGYAANDGPFFGGPRHDEWQLEHNEGRR